LPLAECLNCSSIINDLRIGNLKLNNIAQIGTRCLGTVINIHFALRTENLAETFPSEDYLPQVMSENFGKLEMAVAMFSKSEA
jgi:hypothetical protein